MNELARLQPLIIGIGNPLRSDDGLGWAVTEQLFRDCITGYDIQTVHQLTPELAQSMATAHLVVMIDASREGKPGEMSIRLLSLPAQQSSASTHFTTPEELVLLTSAVYGQCPPVILVTLVGEDFSIGERLSSTVAANIPIVSMAVRQLCAESFPLR
ncbi:MAG TPA: hydrogenase maturation protease [Ktedonobacteraceae bacterium]|nr:hydrogenase maturation protease [Ktedonobacteraceae bacterium]